MKRSQYLVYELQRRCLTLTVTLLIQLKVHTDHFENWKMDKLHTLTHTTEEKQYYGVKATLFIPYQ